MESGQGDARDVTGAEWHSQVDPQDTDLVGQADPPSKWKLSEESAHYTRTIISLTAVGTLHGH